MEQHFDRFRRNDFWVNIHKNTDAYNISTNSKYVNLINHFFPILERNSPTKWKISNNYENMSNLWLPNSCCDQDIMTKFINWSEEVTKEVLWLNLNKNIKEYYDDELDYCIALDFNIIYGEGRTKLGEAEYQLKYKNKDLNLNGKEQYEYIIMRKMLDSCKYIPFTNESNWCVSPMPTTEFGKTKFAWNLAERLSKQLALPFINPILSYNKPQLKNLSIKEKINTWETIYYNNGVKLDENQVRGNNVLVVDDLYQSGVTMWEYAKFLKTIGAKCVFGIVCVKSLRDSDNT